MDKSEDTWKENMTDINSAAWEAVQRLVECGGGLPRDEVGSTFTTSEEISGLCTLIGGGFALQSPDRIWLRPELCIAIIENGGLA